jgi:murein DD-endopeptidase MepM/ murein hydrolase activator NlpD
MKERIMKPSRLNISGKYGSSFKNPRPLLRITLGGLALLLATLSCNTVLTPKPGAQTEIPAATVARAQTAAPTSAVTSPGAKTSPTPAPKPTSAPQSPAATQASCAEDVCTYAGTFLLDRPIGSGGRDTVEAAYRFGILRDNDIGVHHGSDFLNSTGTPVLAAADGKVIVAGNDTHTVYGPRPNTYGNLVIIKHNLPGIPGPVYTLYSQLSQIEVKVGDQVTAGREIGKVGSSGSVKGSTLHFEVRLGDNTYQATRNPELWLKPLPDENGQPEGAIAGRVLNAAGNLVPVSNIIVERLDETGKSTISTIYLKTYADKNLRGQEPWGESFAAGELPAGSYKITFRLSNTHYEQVVKVQPGQLTFVTFHVP